MMLECQQVIYKISILRGLSVRHARTISVRPKPLLRRVVALGCGIGARGNLAGNNSWNCAAALLKCGVVADFWVFHEVPMTLKNVFAAVILATLLVWGGLSMADEYRPDEFLGMDLSKVLLSPKPLGPAQKFVPIQLEARGEGAQASTEPKAEKIVRTKRIEIPSKVADKRADKPRGAARTKLARRHSNPLDAQAFDTRIQVWPCRSGGICHCKP